jgi:hypothetical protein
MAGYKIYNPMLREMAISNDVIFDETFQSALSHTVAVRNKDGDLLREFPLYNSPLTHHMKTDWTGTIQDQFGHKNLITYSEEEFIPPVFPTVIPPGIPPQLGQNLPEDLPEDHGLPQFAAFTTSKELQKPKASKDSPPLSVLFEGGVESTSKMPCKDNTQSFLNTVFKSETNSQEHLSEVQQAFVNLKTNPKEEHFSDVNKLF